MSSTTQKDCVAVIFTSKRTDQDPDGYMEAAQRMEQLAATQPGYLGIESVNSGKHGITISYWADEAAARAWGQHPEHKAIQMLGKSRWYSRFSLKVCRVERGYDWAADSSD